MVNTFSGGMMRRLEIAQALVNRPKVLFLDEPSIGLDPNARRIIWGLIKKLRDEFNTTIMMTTHDMGEADELCDRIGIMNRGTSGHAGQTGGVESGCRRRYHHHQFQQSGLLPETERNGLFHDYRLAGRPLRPGGQ